MKALSGFLRLNEVGRVIGRMSNTGVRWGSSGKSILCQDDKLGVRTITLNNPKKRNVLSYEILQSLEAYLKGVNDKVKVVVIKSTGSVFSSGHDLKELSKEHPSKQHWDIFDLCSRITSSIRDIPVPVVAQVQGMASAAGCQLASSCDITIASRSASFAALGINNGLFCTTPGVPLARSMPRQAVLYMLFTGFPLPAEEAYQLGLISRVVEDDNLESEVQKVIEKIASLSGPAMRLGKKAFYKQADMELKDAYRLASQTMVDNLKLEDAREGIDAFIGKRKPVWKS